MDGPAPPLLWYPHPCTQAWRPTPCGHGHGLPCVQRSEKRQPEKGTQAPSPEAGAREEVSSGGNPPPAPVRTHAGAQVEPPDPHQRTQAPRWSPQTPISTRRRPGGAPRPPSAQMPQMNGCHQHGRMCSLGDGEGEPESPGWGAVMGTPSGSRTVAGPSRWGLQLDSGSRWSGQTRGARAAWRGGGRLGWRSGPQPQWPPQGPSPPSP